MKPISISEAQKMSSPNPFCLVTSLNENGGTNIAAISWWTYLANRPPMLAVCLSSKGYSNQCIKIEKEFGLCLVDKSLSDAAFKCGCISSRSTDKAKDFGIEMFSIDGIKPLLVRESRVIFLCAVKEVVQVGDHDLFISEIKSVYGDNDKRHIYAMNGYTRLSEV